MARRGAESIKVVCFDVDGTLVHHPQEKTVWQVLNETFLGSDALNKERFEMFVGGRISYAEWVALDVGDWIGRDVRREAIVAAVRGALAPVAGAAETIVELKRRGYGLAVISGTLDITLELLLGGLPFDRVFSNRLFFAEDGRISGWQATPYDVKGKAVALEQVAAHFGVGAEHCAFVGDHWNDLPALERAGLGIAFCPKDDQVRRTADIVIEQGPLTHLLELFPGVA